MLIDASAHASPWRTVAPSAKALFALSGAAAAAIAQRPATLAMLAGALMLVALLGARVPLRSWLGAALAPLSFLLLSCLALPIGADAAGAWQWRPELVPLALRTALRSLAVLAALLGLVMTTPLPDLLALLRRVHAPALLLELMVLCYRMLFVLRQAWDEGACAQQARLGYRGWRHGWRSTAQLAGQVGVQVWWRAAALQQALDARCCQGALRFLPSAYPGARRHMAWALLGGAALIGAALGERL